MPAAKLKGSKFYTESDLQAFTESFDKGLKVNFSDGTRPQFVKFGSVRDNDSRCDVKGGRLTLQGYAKYFILDPTNARVCSNYKFNQHGQGASCQVFQTIC